METFDLSRNTKSIARAIEEIDAKYGPISHLYAIAGISNHVKDESAWDMVRAAILGIMCLLTYSLLWSRMLRRK